ncbi:MULTISPECIES: hypothetical protein [unclassified Dietzia]|uniref:hypothetical protein n=1 Tax=unclassified Dietzia TaxID=2617939 RepID=UPI001F230191|nr:MULTISPECIES: hypothetical protein [unclassified Dietzia]
MPLPTRTPARTKRIPHVRNRIGVLMAFAGLAVSLLSLFLPWLSAGGGERISGLGITEIIDVRSVAPVLFLGLLVLALLVTVTAFTRLGAFAVAAAVMAAGVLAGHLAFVWTLILSTGSTTPALSGLPANASVTFGPYVAASGFVVVSAASAWAARSARYARDPLSRRDG